MIHWCYAGQSDQMQCTSLRKLSSEKHWNLWATKREMKSDCYNKEKLRQFESAQLRGDDSPLPTPTPISQVGVAYASDIGNHTTAS